MAAPPGSIKVPVPKAEAEWLGAVWSKHSSVATVGESSIHDQLWFADDSATVSQVSALLVGRAPLGVAFSGGVDSTVDTLPFYKAVTCGSL
jgi:hypothetical protein